MSSEVEDIDPDGGWGLNEAALFFDGLSLVVAYGDDRDITIELDDEYEKALVKALLADVNFWAQFVSALSAAVGKHR